MTLPLFDQLMKEGKKTEAARVFAKEYYENGKILEERARCLLSKRLTNKRQKMALEGVAKSRIDKVNYMDVIADDARLTEIYLAVVKEMAIKHGVDVKSFVKGA